MNRNRTRKLSPTSDDETTPVTAQEDENVSVDPTLERFLNLNANDAYKRPWHRLERGLRLNRLRKFVEAETDRLHLSQQDADLLKQKLDKAFEKKLLNSKTCVIYDIESQQITEIKGLVYHKTSEGRMLSNLLEKKSVTFRRKSTSAAAVAPVVNAPSQVPLPPPVVN